MVQVTAVTGASRAQMRYLANNSTAKSKKQLNGQVKEKWGRLTDDDLTSFRHGSLFVDIICASEPKRSGVAPELCA